jgi:hypothetical protein
VDLPNVVVVVDVVVDDAMKQYGVALSVSASQFNKTFYNCIVFMTLQLSYYISRLINHSIIKATAVV